MESKRIGVTTYKSDTVLQDGYNHTAPSPAHKQTTWDREGLYKKTKSKKAQQKKCSQKSVKSVRQTQVAYSDAATINVRGYGERERWWIPHRLPCA